MKITPVKTAVIGCGVISDIYLKNLSETFLIIDLVGCSDIVDSKAAAQAEKYHIKKMTNEEILNDKEIELVLNLTYASSHYEVSKSILSAGKHCYCEKMMCDTLEEADELGKIAREKNLMFCVAPDTFLGSSQQSSRYYLDSGLIGDAICVIAVLSRNYQLAREDKDDELRKNSIMAKGGGIPYDMGGYYLHQMFNLFGSVNRVFGLSKTYNAHRPYLNPRHSKFNEDYFVDTPNLMSCTLEFDSGVLGTLTVTSDCRVTENTFKVIGTEGILYLSDPNDFGNKIFVSKNGERLELPLTHPYNANSRGLGAADMAWALRTGRHSRMSYKMSYHALEVLKAAEECGRTGVAVQLKTKFEPSEPIPKNFCPGTSMERTLFTY